MKGYILSVVSVAIICAIVRSLLGGTSTTGRIVNLICGILMAVTVVAPLKDISFDMVGSFWNGVRYDAQKYVSEGTLMAENEISHIIKSQCEAYILDKANRMGLQITVEVELDENDRNTPCGVIVSGSVSPYAREQLSSYIEDTLGVCRENQKWT